MSLQLPLQPPAPRVRISRSQSSQSLASHVRTYLLSSLRSQMDLLNSRRNLPELQNHPSALTHLGSGSDLTLTLGALRDLGRSHHPPLAAPVSIRPPSGGGLSVASASSEGGSIGYRDRCPLVPQIKQNFSAPLPEEINKVNILILSLVIL